MKTGIALILGALLASAAFGAGAPTNHPRAKTMGDLKAAAVRAALAAESPSTNRTPQRSSPVSATELMGSGASVRSAYRESREREAESKPPSVVNSAWDGAVHQVVDYLKKNTHDPRSLSYVDWSPVCRVADGYAVRCKFRAKNAFGALVLENMIFTLDFDGAVIGAKQYE